MIHALVARHVHLKEAFKEPFLTAMYMLMIHNLPCILLIRFGMEPRHSGIRAVRIKVIYAPWRLFMRYLWLFGNGVIPSFPQIDDMAPACHSDCPQAGLSGRTGWPKQLLP
jgi:hypothetical protein